MIFRQKFHVFGARVFCAFKHAQPKLLDRSSPRFYPLLLVSTSCEPCKMFGPNRFFEFSNHEILLITCLKNRLFHTMNLFRRDQTTATKSEYVESIYVQWLLSCERLKKFRLKKKAFIDNMNHSSNDQEILLIYMVPWIQFSILQISISKD